MRKTMKVCLSVLLVCSLVLAGCGVDGGQTDTGTSSEGISSENARDEKGDGDNMQITIDGTEYEVELDNNVTIDDIVKKLPIELTLTRYAGHEYYSELPFTPSFAKETTSNIKAGHVYYWDGWNAFVINYEDYDISPYQVVHIGEIKSEDVSEMLKNADETIRVSVNAE